MKTPARKRYTLLASVLLVVGGVVLASFLWVWAEQRQYRMNRALIASLREGDFKRSLQLVEAGADPNTQIFPLPAPTFFQLLNHLFHNSEPLTEESATAFMLTCGAEGYQEEKQTTTTFVPESRIRDHELAVIAKSMIVRGAHINAGDTNKWTALIDASVWGLQDRVSLLLQSGANVNLQNSDGNTALHLAVLTSHIETVKLLLENGANPRLRNKSGDTVLIFARSVHDHPSANSEIISLLKAAGATE